MSKESVSVSNFDEVRLALRKELGLLSKKFQSSLSAVKVDEISNSTDILKLEQIVEILKTMTKLYDSFAKNMELKPQIHVTTPEINIPEIKVPDIHVPEIRVPAINVPTPQVTVNNEFEVDEIIKALEPLKVLSRNPNSPISVRLSDGKKFIDALTKASEDLSEASSKMGVVFAGGGHSISTIDNSASNPVNVTVVGGGASDGAIVDGASASIKATVLDLTSANPLTVAITDANGDQITSFGGGTQYTEGDTDASITGTASMMEGAGNTLLPIQGTVADGLLVNLGSNNDVTVTGTVSVTSLQTDALTDTQLRATAVPVSGTVTSVGTKYNNGGTDDGLNIGVLPAQVGASAPTLNDGRQASLRVTTTGDVAVTLDSESVAVTNAGLTSLNGAIAGTEVQVDVVAPLPAGTNNIGDVDIVSGTITTVSTVTNISQLGGANVPIGAGLEATAIRVTLPTDGTGKVGLIAGTANIGDVDVLSLPAIPAGNNNIGDVDVASIAAGDNNIGNVDIVTMPAVTVTGVSTLAEQQTQTTALQLIDDSVATLGTTTYTETTTKGIVIGAVRRDADTTLVNTTNEVAPLQVDANGYLKVECFSGQTLPASLASASVASGAFASGSIASGAIASGAIAAGAITAGNTSIATTEDTASAAGEHLVKNGIVRYDTPVSGANVSGTADWMPPIADSFGKAWVTGTVPEDTAHISAEAITALGARRIDTCATSVDASGDWGTVNQSAEGALYATLAPTTTSGLSVANFTSGDTYTALTATAQVIKASAGNLYGYYIYNPNSSATYVLLYNIAAASVTVGTSTALMVFCIPATSGANLMFPYPITFSNAGWSIAATTTGGGNTAPATALEAMIWYK